MKKKNTRTTWVGVNIVPIRPTIDDMPREHNNSDIGLLTPLRVDTVCNNEPSIEK